MTFQEKIYDLAKQLTGLLDNDKFVAAMNDSMCTLTEIEAVIDALETCGDMANDTSVFS